MQLTVLSLLYLPCYNFVESKHCKSCRRVSQQRTEYRAQPIIALFRRTTNRTFDLTPSMAAAIGEGKGARGVPPLIGEQHLEFNCFV